MRAESLAIGNRTRYSALLGALAVSVWPLMAQQRVEAYSVEATAGTYAYGAANGYEQNFGSLSTSASANSLGIANASASASAAMGTVGGFASASAVTIDTGFGQLAQGQTWALFIDTLHVGSDSLPVGTPVTLSIDTSLTGGIIGVAGGFSGRAFSNFVAGHQGGNAVATAEQTADWFSGNHTNHSGPITFTTTVGSSVPLQGRLDVTAIAEGVGHAGVACSVTASFGSTATYTVDALTPGVVLTSDSGHDYATIWRADFDGDRDVDVSDLEVFMACFTGPKVPYTSGWCALVPNDQGFVAADFDHDGDVDMADFGAFQRCYSGPGTRPGTRCTP